MNLELPSDLNCNTHIENVTRSLNLEDFHSCTKSMFKLSNKTNYNRYWTREMSSSKKGEFLFHIKKGITLEPYLMQHNKRKLRVITSKLRLSDHCLAIETGRRQSPKINREDRVCQICNGNSLKMKNTFYLNVNNIQWLEMHFWIKFLKVIQVRNNLPLMICFNSCTYVRIKKQSTISSNSLDKLLISEKKHYTL